jgi:hypothetical protein
MDSACWLGFAFCLELACAGFVLFWLGLPILVPVLPCVLPVTLCNHLSQVARVSEGVLRMTPSGT